jgi:hypothetical protein
VPPEALTVALALQTELHVTFSCDCVAVSEEGCVILNVCVKEQLLASVMVQVYVPIHKLIAVAAFPPEGVQAYVYGVFPPETCAIAAPFVPPKQEIFDTVQLTVGPFELLTVAVPLLVQPLASVTTKE